MSDGLIDGVRNCLVCLHGMAAAHSRKSLRGGIGGTEKDSVWGALMRVINNRVEFWVLKVIMVEMKVER